jgi:hypothetical protein
MSSFPRVEQLNEQFQRIKDMPSKTESLKEQSKSLVPTRYRKQGEKYKTVDTHGEYNLLKKLL